MIFYTRYSLIFIADSWKLTLTGIPYVHKINVNLICYWVTQLFHTLLVTCGRSVVFSGYSGSSTNKTDRHDKTEILMKVALNTISSKPLTKFGYVWNSAPKSFKSFGIPIFWLLSISDVRTISDIYILITHLCWSLWSWHIQVYHQITVLYS